MKLPIIFWLLVLLVNVDDYLAESIHLSMENVFGKGHLNYVVVGDVKIISNGNKTGIRKDLREENKIKSTEDKVARFNGSINPAYIIYSETYRHDATSLCFKRISQCREFYIQIWIKLRFQTNLTHSQIFLRHGPRNIPRGLYCIALDNNTIQITYDDGKTSKVTNIIIIKEQWSFVRISLKNSVLKIIVNGITNTSFIEKSKFGNFYSSEEILILGFENTSKEVSVEIKDYTFTVNDPESYFQNDEVKYDSEIREILTRTTSEDKVMTYNGQNYIKYSFLNKISKPSNNEELSLVFKFLEDATSGLIWYSEKGSEKSYIYLKDSKLHYVYVYTTKEDGAIHTAREEIYVPQALAANTYHKIVIQRISNRYSQDSNLILTVNEVLKANKATIIGRVPIIPPDGDVYLGGHYDPKIVTEGKITERFRGQIKQIFVSGEQHEKFNFIDLTNNDNWKNSITIVGDVEGSGVRKVYDYTHTGDYLISATPVPFTFTEFDKLVRFSPWDFDQFESIEIQFRTKEPKGVLLFVGPDNTHTDYVCLEFFDTNFYLAFGIDAKDYRIQLNPKGYPVTNGQFHTVFIKRDRNHKFTAKFDNKDIDLGAQSGHQRQFGSYTYIGGIDNPSRLPWYVWSREGFVGCINYMRVNEDKYIDPRGKNNQYSGDIAGVDIGKCLNDVKQCTASLCEGGSCHDRSFPYLSDKNYFCDCSYVERNYRNPVGNIERGEICVRESETLVSDGSSFYVVDFKSEESRDKMLKTHTDDIRISFKSSHADGTIFKTFRSNSNLYFSAELRGGYVVIETNINDRDDTRKVQTFQIPKGDLNDDKWHTLTIKRRADFLTAYVDTVDNKVEGKIPVLSYGRTFDNTFEFIFVGSSTATTNKDKFVGSMRNFFWNQFDLFGTPRLSGTYRGSIKSPKPELPTLPTYPRDPPVKCTMTFEHRYTKVPNVPATSDEPGFYVEFNTRYNGVIWHGFDIQNPSERYMTLLIIDNQLILVYRMNEDRSVQIIDDGNQVSSSDNSWHRVVVMLHKKLRRITVHIDKGFQPRLFNLAVSNAIELSNMDFYFGGMPDALYNQVFTQLRVTLPRLADKLSLYKEWSLVGCLGEFLVSEDKFMTNRLSSASITYPLNSLDCGGCKSPVKCEVNYCKNKGFCQQISIDRLFCNCTMTGFIGERCEKVEPRCPSGYCRNGGQCFMSGNQPKCECSGTGYQGDRCQESHCSDIYCYNNGVCQIINGAPVCNCRSTKHRGRLCEIPICQDSYCNYRGMCYVENEQAKCDCTATGFIGDKCEKEICPRDFCTNGGKCVPRNNIPACDCTAEYRGLRCEEKVCASYECFNGGSCYIYDDRPKCRCAENFEGEKCEIPRECPLNYCYYGGICKMVYGKPSCDCRSTDYEGARCSTPKQCPSSFCYNGGFCVIFSGKPICQCPKGFRGQLCQEKQECAKDYCMNKGVCSLENHKPKCDCSRTAFSGDRCDKNTLSIVNTYDKYGYIIYHIIPPLSTNEDSVSTGFRTFSSSGTLLTFTTIDGKYWVLRMEDGRLVVDVNGKVHRLQNVVNDGQFYVVNLERRGKNVYFTLNGPTQETVNIDFSDLMNSQNNEIIFTKVHVGADQNEKDFFKGSIGGFNWNGKYIIDAVNKGEGEKKGNVTIELNPFIIVKPPDVCPDNFCANNGRCVMIDYSPFCRCEHTGFFGLRCEQKTWGIFPQKYSYGGYLIMNFIPPSQTNKDEMQLLMQAYTSENPVARFELSNGQYYELKMIGGQLFLYDTKNTLKLVSDGKRMDNGAAYLIKFERIKDNMIFYINGQRTASVKLSNLVDNNGFLTHKRIVLGADIALAKYFQGALGGLIWNGIHLIDNNGNLHPSGEKHGKVKIIPMPNTGLILVPPTREKLPLPGLIPGDNHGGVVWNRNGSIYVPGVGSGGGAFVSSGTGPIVMGAGSFMGLVVSPLLGGLFLAALLFISALIWACWKCKPGCCPCCAGLAHGTPSAAVIKQKLLTPLQGASVSTGGVKTGEKSLWSKITSSLRTPITHDIYASGGYKSDNVALISNANSNGRMAMDQREFQAKTNHEKKMIINQNEGGSMHSLTGGPYLYSGSTNIRSARSTTAASPYAHSYGHGNMLDVNDYRFGTIGQGSIMRIDTTHHETDFQGQPNVLSGEEMKVDCCVLSHNSRYAVTGSANGTPQVWDMQSGELYKMMDGMELGCNDLHLACGDKVLVGLVVDDVISDGGMDHNIRLKRLQTWDFLNGIQINMPFDVMCSSSCITNSGDHLIVNRESQNGATSILCWDLVSNQPVQEIIYQNPDFTNHEGVNFLKVSNNDRMVAAGFTGVDDQAHYMIFDLMAAYPRGVVVQPLIASFNAKTVATDVIGVEEAVTGTKKGELIVWNLRTGKPVRQFLVNATLDGNTQTKLNPHKDAINCVVISKNGEYLVTGSTDKSVNVYTMADERLMHSMEGHADDVLSVAISCDNEIIVSGSWDGSMRVWNVDSGAQMCWFTSNIEILSVKLTNDKKAIVALGERMGLRKLIMLQIIRNRTRRTRHTGGSIGSPSFSPIST